MIYFLTPTKANIPDCFSPYLVRCKQLTSAWLRLVVVLNWKPCISKVTSDFVVFQQVNYLTQVCFEILSPWFNRQLLFLPSCTWLNRSTEEVEFSIASFKPTRFEFLEHFVCNAFQRICFPKELFFGKLLS